LLASSYYSKNEDLYNLVLYSNQIDIQWVRYSISYTIQKPVCKILSQSRSWIDCKTGIPMGLY